MLKITIPGREMFNEKTQEFFNTKEYTLQLEHSLVSVSKWESKWNKPFLDKKPKSIEETIDYIRCMTITQNISPDVYNNLTQENIDAVNKYIDAPMTATTFSNNKGEAQITDNDQIEYYIRIDNKTSGLAKNVEIIERSMNVLSLSHREPKDHRRANSGANTQRSLL